MPSNYIKVYVSESTKGCQWNEPCDRGLGLVAPPLGLQKEERDWKLPVWKLPTILLIMLWLCNEASIKPLNG